MYIQVHPLPIPKLDMRYTDTVPKEASNKASLVFTQGTVDALSQGDHGVGHALSQEKEERFVVSCKFLD